MALTRRHLMESALAVTTLPGAADYFINWAREVAPESHHMAHTAPPEPPLLNGYKPRFFSMEDFEAVESLCSILIPTDELPGANEARCAYYIDYVLAAAGDFAPQRQTLWRQAVVSFKTAGFHTANAARREAIVREAAAPETNPSAQHPAYEAYRLIKSENSFAFYSSRVGLIDNLDYRGNTYNVTFPGCDHPEHHRVA